MMEEKLFEKLNSLSSETQNEINFTLTQLLKNTNDIQSEYRKWWLTVILTTSIFSFITFSFNTIAGIMITAFMTVYYIREYHKMVKLNVLMSINLFMSIIDIFIKIGFTFDEAKCMLVTSVNSKSLWLLAALDTAAAYSEHNQNLPNSLNPASIRAF